MRQEKIVLKNNSKFSKNVLPNIAFDYKQRMFEFFSLVLCLFLLLVYMQPSFAHGASLGNPAKDNDSELKYKIQSKGTQYLNNKKSDVAIRVLVEESNLGSSELEVGEIFLPAGLDTPVHSHGSIEIFYVLSGQLEHVVNGVSHMLEPGMVGIVKPEDNVSHKVPIAADCRALVIWTPGGEIDRIKKNYTQHLIE